MVNRGGITFAHRAQDETMAGPEQVARAYVVCREIFDLDSYVAEVEALDNQLTTDTQALLYLTFRRLLDRSVRWFLQARPDVVDIGAEIARFGPVVSRLAPRIADLLVGADKVALEAETDELLGEGVPPELAARTAGLLTRFMLLDIAEIAAATRESPEDVARIHFALSDRFDVDALLERITRLPRGDRWQALARGSLRYDLYGALRGLTVAVLTEHAARASSRTGSATGRRRTPRRSSGRRGPWPRCGGWSTPTSPRCRWRCGPCGASSAAATSCRRRWPTARTS